MDKREETDMETGAKIGKESSQRASTGDKGGRVAGEDAEAEGGQCERRAGVAMAGQHVCLCEERHEEVQQVGRVRMAGSGRQCVVQMRGGVLVRTVAGSSRHGSHALHSRHEV